MTKQLDMLIRNNVNYLNKCIEPFNKWRYDRYYLYLSKRSMQWIKKCK